MDICATLDTLIDRWCDRRALRPLQLLLRVYPGSVLHTDQKFELLDAMRDVKGLCRAELPDNELRMLIEAVQSLEDSLHGDFAEPGGPANGGQPLSPDSTSTPSAAGFRR